MRIEVAQFHLNIKGLDWTFFGIYGKYYKEFMERKQVSTDSYAACFRHDQVMVFDLSLPYINKTTLHELLHAYVHSCCVGSVSLDSEDKEELICEIIGEHIDEIRGQAKEMSKVLKKDTKRWEKEIKRLLKEAKNG